MIEIKGIGQFDESKGFFEQEDENVKAYCNGFHSQFNYFTAQKKDKYDRPYYWEYIDEQAGVKVTETRVYKKDSTNYFIKTKTFKIEAI